MAQVSLKYQTTLMAYFENPVLVVWLWWRMTRALCCKILYFTSSSEHELNHFDTTDLRDLSADRRLVWNTNYLRWSHCWPKYYENIWTHCREHPCFTFLGQKRNFVNCASPNPGSCDENANGLNNNGGERKNNSLFWQHSRHVFLLTF